MQLNRSRERSDNPPGVTQHAHGRGRKDNVMPCLSSFLGHHCHLPLPAQESPRLLVPSQVGSSPPMRGAFSAAHPLTLPYSSRTGIPPLGATLPKEANPHCLLHQTLTARPLPGIRGLSCRARCFPLMHCPLTNDNDNGNHVY